MKRLTIVVTVLLFLGTPSLRSQVTDYALEFDGFSNYVRVPDSPTLDITGAISIEAWVYIENGRNRPMYFVAKQEGQRFSDNSYALHTQNDFSPAMFVGCPPVGPRGPLPEGLWTHVAGVFDGAFMRILVDGVVVDSGVVLESIGSSSAECLVTNDRDVLLGRLNDFTRYNLHGKLDEVRIWSSARTDEEIKTFMGCGLTGAVLGDPNLVAYWDFNEGAGDILHDLSGNGNHGTLINNPLWVASGAPIGNVCAPPGSGSDTLLNPHNGHTYLIESIPPNFTWQQARDSSIELGGHLVTIENQSEMDFVVDILGVMISKPVWLGGWEPTEGNWVWVTNEPFAYTNWCAGEPNEAFAGEDFIAIGTGVTCWNDSRNWFTTDGLFIVEFESAEVCCVTPGDIDNDSDVDLQDVATLTNYIMGGGSVNVCCQTLDVDGSLRVDVSDVQRLLSFLFNDGPSPVCSSIEGSDCAGFVPQQEIEPSF